MIQGVGMAIAFLLLLSTTVQATLDLNVTGNLLPPVCTIHDGNNGTLNVEFGDDININRLDGVRYRQTVPYQIDCEDDGQQWRLKLKVVGVAAWNNQTLQSDKSNLGLRLELAGRAVELGVDIPVSSASGLPTLTVVPVKNPLALPDEGLFNATANLQAEYF